MAKKGIATTEEKAGRGQKKCPACGSVVGARSAECECGHKFEVKTGGGRKASSSKDGLGAIKAAVEFIRTTGGIEEAKAQVGDMMVFLAACGGTSEAMAAIEQVEEIQGLTKKK